MEQHRHAPDIGWNVLCWITMDDNYRARGKYDEVAQWATDNMTPPA
ncbi:hypothetical protein [Streptomyces decoyicus]